MDNISVSSNDNIVLAQPDRKGFALTSFIIGIAGLLTMLIPIINIPAQIVGLIFGILGRKSSKRKKAIIGITLNCFSIVLSVIWITVFLSLFGNTLNEAKLKAPENIDLAISKNGGISATLKPKLISNSDSLDSELALSSEILSKRLRALYDGNCIVYVNNETQTLSVKISNSSKSRYKNIYELLGIATRRSNFTIRESDTTIITGKDIKNAGFIKDNNNILLSIDFKEEAAKRFEEATGRRIGKRMSIFIDDNLICEPTVNDKITDGSFVVNFNNNVDEVAELVSLIKYGPLPFEFDIKDIITHPKED